jgi:hypothetical protein
VSGYVNQSGITDGVVDLRVVSSGLSSGFVAVVVVFVVFGETVVVFVVPGETVVVLV